MRNGILKVKVHESGSSETELSDWSEVGAHAYVSYARCACAFDGLYGGAVVVIRLTTVFTCVLIRKNNVKSGC
ncbi:hypothetical protein evm_011396 [Chilo suppressalis]|nr:hypothetical protein evm_011396 [Chilo suppressalis]